MVDVELDWSGWPDHQDKKRQAETLRARDVLSEGGRAAVAANGGEVEQADASPSPGEVGVDDLPL